MMLKLLSLIVENLNRMLHNKRSGFSKVSYQGGERFFYAYKGENRLKTGLFVAKVKYFLPTIIVLGSACSLGWGSYFLFNSPAAAEVVSHDSEFARKAVAGVGGVGAIDDSKVTKSSDIYKVEDEKRKDALLGISESEPELPVGSEDSEIIEDKKPVLQKMKYRVRPGDSIDTIARKFRVSVGSIAGSSNLIVVDDLKIGQVLYIPSQEGFFYKIKKNDRLAYILNKYRVTLDKFLRLNANVNPDLLDVGDDIFLPGAKPKNIVRGWFIPVVSRIITSG